MESLCHHLAVRATAIMGLSVLVVVPLSLEAADPPETSFDQVMNQIDVLDEQGDHGAALAALIPALENYSDSSWTRKHYKTALYWAWGCFAKLDPSQREQFLSQYTATAADEGELSIPPLRDLTGWLQEVMPSTALSSLRARLPLAIWHHLQGNEALFVAYGLSIVEQAPESLAAEYAIIYVYGVQYYGFQRQRMLQTVRTAARLAPDNRGAAWACTRAVLCLSSAGLAEQAKELIGDVRAEANGHLAGTVADDLAAVVRDIESSAYPSAVARIRQLEPYLEPGPMIDLVDVLSINIDWLHRTSNPDTKARLKAIIRVGEQEAENTDPKRKGYGLLLQARFWQKQGRAKRAVSLYREAIATEQAGVQECARSQIGRLLERANPKGAIEILEDFRRNHAKDPGAERPLSRLARLYLKQGRYAEGLALYQELRRRDENGFSASRLDGECLAVGQAECLRGLGRTQEADGLAGPILERYGYGSPLEELERSQLSRLQVLLGEMGREKEAKQLREECGRRLKAQAQ